MSPADLIAEVRRLAAEVPADLMTEGHGDGVAVYSGRDSEHHGLRHFNVSDGDRYTPAILDLLCGYRTLAPALADALEAALREAGSLRAARLAYASEFPAGADGLPDVGSVHENIRRLKDDLARLRVGLERLADEFGSKSDYSWVRAGDLEEDGDDEEATEREIRAMVQEDAEKAIRALLAEGGA